MVEVRSFFTPLDHLKNLLKPPQTTNFVNFNLILLKFALEIKYKLQWAFSIINWGSKQIISKNQSICHFTAICKWDFWTRRFMRPLALSAHLSRRAVSYFIFVHPYVGQSFVLPWVCPSVPNAFGKICKNTFVKHFVNASEKKRELWQNYEVHSFENHVNLSETLSKWQILQKNTKNLT